jgi:hypothetical protein
MAASLDEFEAEFAKSEAKKGSWTKLRVWAAVYLRLPGPPLYS